MPWMHVFHFHTTRKRISNTRRKEPFNYLRDHPCKNEHSDFSPDPSRGFHLILSMAHSDVTMCRNKSGEICLYGFDVFWMMGHHKSWTHPLWRSLSLVDGVHNVSNLLLLPCRWDSCDRTEAQDCMHNFCASQSRTAPV